MSKSLLICIDSSLRLMPWRGGIAVVFGSSSRGLSARWSPAKRNMREFAFCVWEFQLRLVEVLVSYSIVMY